MTDDAFRAAFPLRRYYPDRGAEAFALYLASCELHTFADRVWAFWWWSKGSDPATEAVVFQATDYLIRASGLCALESARMVVNGD